ncbi:MAG: hypothetical protein DVB22_000122 [Verrucomicrobia bacterium]|nr:MAG: hypothetical protein DVB22_000122 [Verrucomicrobiota bacterium]
MSRYEEIDFAALPVRRLNPLQMPSHAGFRPRRGEFGTYWKQGKIARECTASICACWYLDVDGVLAAYITLISDRLLVESPLLEAEKVRYRSFPAIKIGLLAADQRAKGAGTALMKWAFRYIACELCPRVGARFVTVDALFDPDNDYDVAGYYEKFGFVFADPSGVPREGEQFRTMFFDLKPLLDALDT